MVVTKCDRCGKEFVPRTFISSEGVVQVNKIENFDLCNECKNLFYDFINGKAIKGVDNASH